LGRRLLVRAVTETADGYFDRRVIAGHPPVRAAPLGHPWDTITGPGYSQMAASKNRFLGNNTSQCVDRCTTGPESTACYYASKGWTKSPTDTYRFTGIDGYCHQLPSIGTGTFQGYSIPYSQLDLLEALLPFSPGSAIKAASARCRVS